MTTRTQRVADAAALEAAKERYATDHGYRITVDEPGEAVAKQSYWGGIWLHIGLLLISAGFGNLLYLLYRAVYNETVVIRVDPSVADSGDGGEA